jgi:recombination protein RecT
MTERKKVSFALQIQGEGYQKVINDTLGDKKSAQTFISNIVSFVGTNPALQKCENDTIVRAALEGFVLNLSPSLHQFYLVPYGTKATFILGYKGMIQLAIRSGQYKRLGAVEIKEGELISYDPIRETYVFIPIKDRASRTKAETIGYYSFFELTAGFFKEIYWTKEEVIHHANRYSKAFNADVYRQILAGKINPEGNSKYSSPWYESFDLMGRKTMLRQLLSTWGPMSVEMQKAFESDGDYSEPREYLHAEDNIDDDGFDGEVVEVKDVTESSTEQVRLDDLAEGK